MPPALPAPLQPLADHSRRSALFLDFDGTLSAIVEDPVGATPLPGVPELLEDLADELASVIRARPGRAVRESRANRHAS